MTENTLSPTRSLTHHQYEQAVYDYLTALREIHPDWHFAMRHRGKGLEQQRFIGVEGRYFGTTFWKVKTDSFTGPTYPIALYFWPADDGMGYHLEGRQSRLGTSNRDQALLTIVDTLLTDEGGFADRAVGRDEDNKNQVVHITGREASYPTVEAMFADVRRDLELFIPFIDRQLAQAKQTVPNFRYRRYTQADTDRFKRRYAERNAPSVRYEDELTVAEWSAVWNNPEITLAQDREVVLAFYHSDNHSNYSKYVDVQLNDKPAGTGQSGGINGRVVAYARRVYGQLARPLTLRKRENDKEMYWPILFDGSDTPEGFKWTLKPNLVQVIQQRGTPSWSAPSSTTMSAPLNQVLYGPPGTGKTYTTISRAVAIAEDIDTAEVLAQDRGSVLDRYRQYREAGRIVFTTFHQSLSYEDFVEGLKPVLSDTEGESEEIKYEIKSGIFKALVDTAQAAKEAAKDARTHRGLLIDKKTIKAAKPYKISLGDSRDENDSDIYQYCIDNNCIALGYGGEVDLTAATNEKEIAAAINANREEGVWSTYELIALKAFCFWMQKGDLVFIPNGLFKIRAVGIITGDYYYAPDAPIRYSQFRKVSWLYTDIDFPIKEVYGKPYR